MKSKAETNKEHLLTLQPAVFRQRLQRPLSRQEGFNWMVLGSVEDLAEKSFVFHIQLKNEIGNQFPSEKVNQNLENNRKNRDGFLLNTKRQ